jgi:PKD repeat protein/sugar lactone lactonase YvrE
MRAARATAIFAILISGVSAAVVIAAEEAAPAIAEDPTSEVLLDETFEQVFPRLPWRVSHPAGAADVDWGRSKHRASGDRYSIYCAGMGPAKPEDGGPAPANTASWTIVGPFDLGETTAGTLTFDLWMQTEEFQDVFMWLVSTDGQTFNGSAKSTNTSGWQTVTTDLANWGAAGSVIGETEIWIAFVYQSDRSNLFEGAYVDEVKLVVDLGATGEEGRTYSTDADFAEGVSVGVESESDELVLTDDWDALPYLWVPNSVTGTISKIDVDLGDELGRYRTGPTSEGNPGVAAVDLEGSCWVGNRNTGTIVKIGLLENGGCTDRDGDGEIETSTDRNNDGDITGSELLSWGDDECVLVEAVLVEGLEGTYVPGEDHDDYQDNDLQAAAVDADGNIWVGVYQSNVLYHLDGASGVVLDTIDLSDDATYPTAVVVDKEGTVWVTSWPDRWVMAYDPVSRQTTLIDLVHGSRGIAIDRSDGLFVTGDNDRLFSKIDTVSQEVLWTQIAGWLANGVAATETGEMWIAAAGDGTVSRYSPTGGLTRTVVVPGGPTGLAVDQAGRIWVAGVQNDIVYRLDPTAVVSDLDKRIAGSASHDATGDLTGIVARNLTSRYGTWTVVFDSQVAGTPWGRISWQADTPSGTQVRVRVRSSADKESWSPWEPAADGVELGFTPPGRYIEIQAALHVATGDELPTLRELTVEPVVVVPAPVADFTWTPSDPVAGQPVTFQDASTGPPTEWAWTFGDGATSAEENPTHTFAGDGAFDVGLAVTNSSGTDAVTKTVTVAPVSGCTVTCSATAPQTTDLGVPTTFQSTATSTSCAGEPTYAWDFGDGGTSDLQNPVHAYTAVGTFRWRMTASADGADCTAAGDITVSGDGPDSCPHTYWVPVVSRTGGANGSVWRTDLGLLGADPDGADVELRYHDGGSEPVRTVTVVSGAMVNLVDVVDWIDSGSSGSGSLEICSDGELVVDSRTYNLLASDHGCFPGGTFGQHLAGSDGGSGLSEGETARLGQLRESNAFRTNIGIVNTGSSSATVSVVLFDASGTELTTFGLEIEPGRWLQENRPFERRAGRSDLDSASATVTVVGGAGVIAYASVIDNLTNDATTIPMR